MGKVITVSQNTFNRLLKEDEEPYITMSDGTENVELDTWREFWEKLEKACNDNEWEYYPSDHTIVFDSTELKIYFDDDINQGYILDLTNWYGDNLEDNKKLITNITKVVNLLQDINNNISHFS